MYFYIALLCNNRQDFYFGASAELLVRARHTEKQADVVAHTLVSTLVKRNNIKILMPFKGEKDYKRRSEDFLSEHAANEVFCLFVIYFNFVLL